MFFFGKKRPNKESDGKERRRSPRLAARNLVRVAREDGSVEELSNIYDISEGGMRIVCHTLFDLQSVLRVTLNIPEKNQSLELKARILWILPMKGQKGAYFAGAEFAGTSDEDRRTLRGFIEDRLREGGQKV